MALLLATLLGSRPAVAGAQQRTNRDSLAVAHLRLDTLPRLHPEEMVGLWSQVPLVRSTRSQWYHLKADSTFEILLVRTGLCSSADSARGTYTGLCRRRSVIRRGYWWVLERKTNVTTEWLCLGRTRTFDGRCYQILADPGVVSSEIRLVTVDLDLRLVLVARDAREVLQAWDREP